MMEVCFGAATAVGRHGRDERAGPATCETELEGLGSVHQPHDEGDPERYYEDAQSFSWATVSARFAALCWRSYINVRA
jgi:hypothetical protein